MPDTIHSLFSCHCRFLREAKPRTRRSEAQEMAVPVDNTEVATAEARDPATIFELGEADKFTGQRLTNEHFLASPFDCTAGAHPPHLVIGVIPGVIDLRWQGAGRWLPTVR